MKYRQLGRTGLDVSEVGFGAWAIGGADWGETDDDVSRNALRAALDSQVTFIDTADVYGNGHSEDLVAEVLDEEKYKYSGVVVGTKAGNDFYKTPRQANWSPDYLIFAAKKSCQRLKVTTLDLLQLHGPSEADMKAGVLEAFSELKRQGVIRWAGVSVRSFCESEGVTAIESGHVDVLQVRYNVLEQEADKELFPLALKENIGIIVRIPILFGLLAGKFNHDSRFGDDDHRRFNLSPEKLAELLPKVEKLKRFIGESETMAQFALRFILSNPAVSTVIPGAKTHEQAAANAAASELGPLPREVLSELQDMYSNNFE